MLIEINDWMGDKWLLHRRILFNISWYSISTEDGTLIPSPNAYPFKHTLDIVTCFRRIQYERGNTVTLQWKNLAYTTMAKWSVMPCGSYVPHTTWLEEDFSVIFFLKTDNPSLS